MTWEPIFVLPNIALGHAFENEKVAVTPITDHRVNAYKNIEILQNFLSRFQDQHGNTVNPSIIWWNFNDEVNKPDFEALASFRDAISISYVSSHWASKVQARVLGNIIYSDYFQFYPWYLLQDGEWIAASVPLMSSVHELSSFRGQTTPGLHSAFQTCDYDKPLFHALEIRWRQRWLENDQSWENRALFRSLNMAYAASMMPTGTQPATFYDYGRMLALWVSAFEIIARDGEDEKTGLLNVFTILEKVSYISDPEKHLTYDGYASKGCKKMKLRSLPCYLYEEIYKARNDFLHGNKIESDRLSVNVKYPLDNFAAPLYRLALTAFLGISYQERAGDAHDTNRRVTQFQIECALSKAAPKT